MKHLIAATEHQYGNGKNAYYKIYVQRADGRMLKGTRSLGAWRAGSTLERKCKNLQADIDRGAYNTLAERE